LLLNRNFPADLLPLVFKIMPLVEPTCHQPTSPLNFRQQRQEITMKANGFSLIEMMFTVAISAVVLGLAVPSLRDFLNNNRTATQTNDLVSDLTLARNESTKRGMPVTICASSNGTSCGIGGWAGGRIVFLDKDGDGSVDTGDTVLRVAAALPANFTLASANFASASYIQYLPSGALDFSGAATSEGKFTLCMSGYKGREVSINAVGRVRTVQTSSTCS
jgi:type IV fimbrial biogenesis protein FimT